jgi:hypothetical protein
MMMMMYRSSETTTATEQSEMREIKLYQCEICGSKYPDSEQATACESSGLPRPMPFLPWNREIPCFGEDRIEYGQLIAVEVGCTIGDWYTLQMIQEAAAKSQCRLWRVHTRPWVSVSHNLDSDVPRPAYVFDPRHGLDAFRHFGTLNDLSVWENAMRDYGFGEQEVGAYVMEGVRRMRTLRGQGASNEPLAPRECYAQDVLAARRPQTERLEDIAFAIRQERGGSIPVTVADKLLAKLRARGVDT